MSLTFAGLESRAWWGYKGRHGDRAAIGLRGPLGLPISWPPGFLETQAVDELKRREPAFKLCGRKMGRDYGVWKKGQRPGAPRRWDEVDESELAGEHDAG